MDNVVAFVAHRMQVQVHQHRCYQILLSLDAPFSTEIDGTLHGNQYGLIINQNVQHACKALDGSALIYFIDSHSAIGQRIKQMLNSQSHMSIRSAPTCTPWIKAQSPESASKSQWQTFANKTLDQLIAINLQSRTDRPDQRIKSAIDFLMTRLSDKVTLHDVGKHISLSVERTRHLFTQETGAPFTQFMLWQRLKSSITLIVQDQQTLTESALQTGFSDQAHFCRVFKRTFGIAAKGLLKNSRFIQFIQP